MARAIPEQDSTAPIDGQELLPLFTIGQDNPQSQAVDDVLQHGLTEDAPPPISTSPDVGDGEKAARSNHTHDLGNQVVRRVNIGDGQVDTDQLKDGAISSDKMGANSVAQDAIVDQEVTLQKLNPDAAPAEWAIAQNGSVQLPASKIPINSISKTRLTSGVRAELAAAWADVGSELVPGTGVSITINADGNYVISVLGASTPSTHQRYGAFKRYASTAAVPTFSAAEFQAGVGSTTESVDLSSAGATDASGQVFAISFWSAMPITFITSANTAPAGQNIFRDFTLRSRLTIDGVNGYVYGDSGLLNAAQINTDWTVR